MLLNGEQLSFNSLDCGLMGRRWDLENPYRKSTFLQRVLNIMQRCLTQAFYRTSKWPVEPAQGLPHYLLKWRFWFWQ